MNRFLIQYKDRLVAVGVGCAIIGSVFYGIVPFLHAVSRARSDIAEKNIAQEVLLSRIAQKEQLTQRRNAIIENRDAIPVAPTEAQIITLIDTMERIAKKRRVAIRFAALTDEAIKLQKQKAESQKKDGTDTAVKTSRFGAEKYFVITLRGTFDEIVGMLYTLENAQYYIFMDAVTIVPQERTQRNEHVTGVILQAPGENRTTETVPAVTDNSVIATISARIPFKEQK